MKPLNITDANREQLFAASLAGLPLETLCPMLRDVEAKLRRPMYPQQATRYTVRRDAIQTAIAHLTAA